MGRPLRRVACLARARIGIVPATTLNAEISMYPFKDDFRPDIDAFVRGLRERDGIRVRVGTTSTVAVGDHDIVMSALTDLLRSNPTEGRAAFVAKLIPGFDAFEATQAGSDSYLDT